MALWLKQSTSTTIQFGPFLDKTDGVTLEVGLATALDNATTGIRLTKNGAAQVDRNDATAPAYTAMGLYTVVLDATDTGTLGNLRIIFEESATCLPVWQDFMIVPANVYNSFVLGTDVLDVSLTQVNGAAQTATLDTIKAETVLILADTAEIGTAGIGLSNIGTIATVTNLTNAPTNGDLTATMKTSVTTAASSSTPSVTVSDKSGFSLSTAGILAIWHQLTSAIVTAGTAGKLIVDNLNATVSSRMATTHLDATAGKLDGVALADTVTTYTNNTLQTGDTYALANGAAGFAAINTDVELILADTGELQVDWADGGRLDLIQDIIAADTTTDIPALIATAQTDLDTISNGIINGTAATSFATTSCGSNLTGYTNDQLIGRVITFLAGPADGESSGITDYVSTDGVITFDALTLAPETGNAFKIT